MALTGAFEPLDHSGMRRTMGRFLTGVAVVTARQDGEDVGMTISSLTSISLDPAILMISLNYGTRTGDAITETGGFAVSILGVKQEAVARQFAVRGGTRFDAGDFDRTPRGLPAVVNALAQVDCDVHESVGVGDHRVFFGAVTSGRFRDGSPLAFSSGRFGAFQDFNHEPPQWLF